MIAYHPLNFGTEPMKNYGHGIEKLFWKSIFEFRSFDYYDQYLEKRNNRKLILNYL